MPIDETVDEMARSMTVMGCSDTDVINGIVSPNSENCPTTCSSSKSLTLKILDHRPK